MKHIFYIITYATCVIYEKRTKILLQTDSEMIYINEEGTLRYVFVIENKSEQIYMTNVKIICRGIEWICSKEHLFCGKVQLATKYSEQINLADMKTTSILRL